VLTPFFALSELYPFGVPTTRVYVSSYEDIDHDDEDEEPEEKPEPATEPFKGEQLAIACAEDGHLAILVIPSLCLLFAPRLVMIFNIQKDLYLLPIERGTQLTATRYGRLDILKYCKEKSDALALLPYVLHGVDTLCCA